MIGQNWAQSGVADLFSKIKCNGYHIMYLTARALGQASTTKGYLQTLKQGDVCLPDGPLFLNLDSLVHAIKREVIDKNPEEFKIRCMKDIQSLFGDKNPFFAGYGNRPNVRDTQHRYILVFENEFRLLGCFCLPCLRYSCLPNIHHKPCWRSKT